MVIIEDTHLTSDTQGVSLSKFCAGDIRRDNATMWRRFSFTAMEMTDIPLVPASVPELLGCNWPVCRIAFSNALYLLLSGDPTRVFARLRFLSGPCPDGIFEQVHTLIDRVKHFDIDAITDIFHLAYFEWVLGLSGGMPWKRIVLPKKENREIIFDIVTAMAAAMSPCKDIVYQPSLEGAYSSVIGHGTVSFLVDDTFWLFRLGSRGRGNVCGSDHIPLVVAWVMSQQSPLYKDKPIRYLSYMSPLDRKYTRVDVQTLPEYVKKAVYDAIYPPQATDNVGVTSSEPDESFVLKPAIPGFSINEWERVKLISAFTLTANIGESKHRVKQELINICHNHIADPRVKSLCRQIFAIHTLPPYPFDAGCDYCRKRVILLNRLYYTLNNLNLSRIPQVTLSDDEITCVINKASALYY